MIRGRTGQAFDRGKAVQNFFDRREAPHLDQFDQADLERETGISRILQAALGLGDRVEKAN